MAVREITNRQEEILRFILRCWKSGFIPTVRQIGAEFDITPNAVMGHLRALRKKGYVGAQEEHGSIRLTRTALAKA